MKKNAEFPASEDGINKATETSLEMLLRSPLGTQVEIKTGSIEYFQSLGQDQKGFFMQFNFPNPEDSGKVLENLPAEPQEDGSFRVYPKQ